MSWIFSKFSGWTARKNRKYGWQEPHTMYGEEHFQPTWSSTILITSYPGYGQRELCYSPLTGFLSMLQQFGTLPRQCVGTHSYSWVKRGTVTVEWTAQEHNIMIQDRTEPWLLDSGVHSTRLPCSTRLSLLLHFAIDFLTTMSDQDRISHYNVTQISDKNKGKNIN